TTQIRQAFAGVSVSPKQSVGVSIPSFLHASRSVEPSGTSTSCPSMVSEISRTDGSVDTTGSSIIATSRGTRSSRSSIEHTEALDRGLDRRRRGLPEAADRGVPHRLPDLRDQRELVLDRSARHTRQQPRERLLLAHSSHPAGHALTAALV